MTTPDALVRKLIAGDVTAISELRSLTPAQLSGAADGHTYTVQADVVANVLTRYVEGEISAERTQQWASFVRWGQVPSSNGGVTEALEIEYDAAHEDAIGEVIARLDELGDVIDGEVTAAMADNMRRALMAPARG